jgi:uncharacterized protein YrrD
VPDRVSWKVVEKGWDVVGRDGEKVGTVHEVLGDENADIFNGLNVSPGLVRNSRYVPAERVREIVEGRVVLDLPAGRFEQLDEAEPAPTSAEIRADTTDLPEDEA